MLEIDIVRDTTRCRELWEEFVANARIWDLWQIRSCFGEKFGHPLYFVVARRKGEMCGFLPLVWLDREQRFVFYPGETWKGRTWLEHNQLIVDSPWTLDAMLEAVPGPLELRYCLNAVNTGGHGTLPDETNYYLHTADYGYKFENYIGSFSSKSRRRLLAVEDEFDGRGMTWRMDEYNDINLMLDMNIDSFGTESYFSCDDFRNGFLDLVDSCRRQGWLRITTALVGGKPAAVDVGIVFNTIYTVMAGGTSPEFPGIAKVINMRHIMNSFESRFAELDFMCGDFGWKERYHLSQRPMYRLNANSVTLAEAEESCSYVS
ncbi:MAG TPA: GNAT family N-acetyltransferase [Phycisphaerae bacterium]|nr:GNAT family N-acetyltransferase [Phycisphaerae bacterium]